MNDIRISVGRGKARYKLDRGSFKTSEIILEKRSLKRAEGEGDTAVFSDGKYEVKLTKTSDGARTELALELPRGINRVWITLPAFEDERIYGCGEQFSEHDLKGKKSIVWVSEHHSVIKFAKKFLREKLLGVNYDYRPNYRLHMSYHAQPSFMSSKKYFVHADSECYAEFSFKKTHTTLYFRGVPRSLTFLRAQSFPELMTLVSDLLGKQPPLPDWVSDGAIIASQGGIDKAVAKLEDVRAAGAKVAGIWSQDWSGQIVTEFGTQVYWNWSASNELYPELSRRARELRAEGVRFLGYINTFLKRDAPLYNEAKSLGYLVGRKDGAVYHIKSTTFDAGIVDLTNPAAFEWYKGIIKRNMLGIGLGGWMADFGEYLPTDAKVFGGSAEELHNLWPTLWARLNREAVDECGLADKTFFFSRAAYTKTPSYTNSMWCGDQHVDYSDADGLASVIPATLSMACQGVGFIHSDVGGYTTVLHMKRTPELFMRWAELNIFTPVLRCHEGNRPAANAQFDHPETREHFARMTRLFVSLKPYRERCVNEYLKSGMPVNRPLFFHFDEPFAYDTKTEFMFGDELIVCPVLRPSVEKRDVELPAGEWRRLYTNESFCGGKHTVEAPIGRPVAFYAANGPSAKFFEGLKNE